MSREFEQFEQFKKDIDFVLKNKDNWIFQPLYALTRRLILYYESFYELKNDRSENIKEKQYNER